MNTNTRAREDVTALMVAATVPQNGASRIPAGEHTGEGAKTISFPKTTGIWRVDTYARDLKGETALHYACNFGNESAVEQLLAISQIGVNQ